MRRSLFCLYALARVRSRVVIWEQDRRPVSIRPRRRERLRTHRDRDAGALFVAGWQLQCSSVLRWPMWLGRGEEAVEAGEEHHGGQNKLRIAGSVTQVDKIRSLYTFSITRQNARSSVTCTLTSLRKQSGLQVSSLPPLYFTLSRTTRCRTVARHHPPRPPTLQHHHALPRLLPYSAWNRSFACHFV